MEAILIGLAIGLVLWFFLKQRQGSSGGFFSASPQPVRPPPQPQKAMPRIGEPGTITEEQFNALNRNLFTPSKEWSFEEAALVLDAVTYLRSVCASAIHVREPALEVQNALLAFILADEDLRNHVRRWGETQRAEGIADDEPELKHNNQFERVARAARELTGYDDEPTG